MSAHCPDCGAVASHGHEIGHRSDCPSFSRKVPVAFDNGLTSDQSDEIDNIRIDLIRLRQRIDALGRHRTYSLAITKIEEAEHWLRARTTSAP